MEYTYSDELYSDFHKDTYGVRPGESAFRYWNSLTPDQKQAEWEQMGETMRVEQQREKQQQKRAIVEYELQIAQNLDLGADSRKDAVRWILDSMELSAYDDAGFVCYRLGLPYRMEHEFADILAEMHKEAA